jgi:hypothetical protein
MVSDGGSDQKASDLCVVEIELFIRRKVSSYDRLSSQQGSALVAFSECLCSRESRHEQTGSVEHGCRITSHRVQHSGNPVEIVWVVAEPLVVATDASIDADDRRQGGEGQWSASHWRISAFSIICCSIQSQSSSVKSYSETAVCCFSL